MEWLKHEWPRLVVAGLIETAIGLIALGVISATVDNSDIRDIGIVAIWVAVILGGAAFLIVRMITTSGLVRREDVPGIIKEKLETGPPIPLEEPTTPSLSPSATDSMAEFDPYSLMFSKIMRESSHWYVSLPRRCVDAAVLNEKSGPHLFLSQLFAVERGVFLSHARREPVRLSGERTLSSGAPLLAGRGLGG